MSAAGKDGLESLIHDMNSKCASLKTAIGLLRTASSEERGELLTLMKQQAKNIAEDIVTFEASVGSK
jgi:hypothetical protein